jgi:sugar/nucleoside kinase (ribokinase family)
LIRRPRVATRGAIIVVEQASGRRTVLEHRDPAVAMMPAEVSEAVITSGRLLLVDARDPAISLAAARLARRAGVPVVVDVEHATRGVDQLLREVDVIVAAEGFPREMTGIEAPGRALARLATEFRPSLAVVTLGPRGSLARSGGREIRTAAFKVPVVDTTGAGDAFRAGLISGWLGSTDARDVSQVLRYANAVAALNCRQLGAQAGLPTAAEVAVFVTGNRHGQSK